MKFNAGDYIRNVAGKWVTNRSCGFYRYGTDLAYALDHARPFDLETLKRWLAEGSNVGVYTKNRAESVYRMEHGVVRRGYTDLTEKQLAARTRTAVWMVRA